ncbi:unnamed protein product [Didymodactylos carnosus]|uniref:Reverse transcriptase domain-containing protein n=1 Tax=Didymodactylos carnosus TaxID=1234261 RepID=A0A816GGK3_9BILA|nr:unnamed protein product [Didymodactylos carnosus]CAF1673834.1 unnamed protein product [Didymodactylos carnosus]CAF4028449.1 unnamed protein product [Didymodactylos carnosus]CAF4656149.1 unnamed protein product [Didymodactylos carnosus]
MSKILERLVYNKLYEHLKKHDLLTPLQSGFIQGDSTTNQLVDLVHEIGENLDFNKFTTAVFLDFANRGVQKADQESSADHSKFVKFLKLK